MQGKIITIANNKGGTGKTTITTHLGVAMAKLNKKILLIDNDPQCNTTALMARNQTGYKTMYNLLTEKECQLKQYLTPTFLPNLHCITNIVATSGLSLTFNQQFPDSLMEIRKIRSTMQESFDYVLLDCPPTLDIPMGQALCASDVVLVPIDAGSIHSIDGLSEVLDMIEAMQEYNKDLSFLKMVMNKADRRTSISKLMIKDIQDEYPDYYFDTVIPICTAIQQAEYLRKTVHEYRPTSNVIAKYKELAQEIIKEIG